MEKLVMLGCLASLVLSSPVPDERFYAPHRNSMYYAPYGIPYDPSPFYYPREAYGPSEAASQRFVPADVKNDPSKPLTVQLVLSNVPEGASVSVSVTVNGKPTEVSGSPAVLVTPSQPAGVQQPVDPPVQKPVDPAAGPVTAPTPEEEEGGSISIEVLPEQISNATEASTEEMVIAISNIDTSIHFPESIASPESSLDNREPSPPVAPGGIISSNQPTVITPPFDNPKDSPLLVALQAAAVRT